ncbi:MAG: hypothetical protein CMLOHMNK_00157 [Steroidobacteraceae bacterium]|nr:hypothetical protein [Steroidobacteraceae bacterium]
MLRLALLAVLPAGVFALGHDRAVVDGMTIELRRYRASMPPAEVLARWPLEGTAGPERRSAGDWLVVSRLQGRLQETLQARPDGAGGSEVLLSRVDLRAPLAALVPPPFTLPAGSSVLRTIGFEEAAGRATQFVISLPGRPGHALPILCARLLERGWRPSGSRGCDGSLPTGPRWFLRGGETLAVDLRVDGARSRAVIGHVVPRP